MSGELPVAAHRAPDEDVVPAADEEARDIDGGVVDLERPPIVVERRMREPVQVEGRVARPESGVRGQRQYPEEPGRVAERPRVRTEGGLVAAPGGHVEGEEVRPGRRERE